MKPRLMRAFLVSLLCTVMGLQGFSPQVARAQPAAAATKAPAAPATENEVTLYTLLLKRPELLGFKPDQKRFDMVYEQVRSMHVEDPPERQLMDGVAEEVTYLLGAAGLSTGSLDGFPHDKSLPEKIATAYASRVNASVLWYAMLSGLMKGTHDPYTAYMTPNQFKNLSGTLTSSEFEGVGLYIDNDATTHQTTIMHAIEGSPAQQAGLAPGDEIVRINGELTHDMQVEAIYKALHGERGSTIYVTYHRPGEEGLHVTSFQRALFEMPSVTSELLHNDIGYIRLYTFGLVTASRMKDAIDEFVKKGVKGLIIDVRNNPGGYTFSAGNVCGLFLHPDETVSLMVDRHGAHADIKGGSLSRVRLPTVLLINKSSASASEVTAACFKDYGIATLIGVQSYGKGCSQQVFSQSDGSAFKVTMCYFTGPKGTRIHKIGVKPDINVEMEPRWVGNREHDVQLKKAVDFLTTGSR